MFRLTIDDDELDAEFYCPFCETTQEWPFGARIVWKGTNQQSAYPAVDNVIMSHWFGDWNLKRFGFNACTKTHMWSSTDWQTIDGETGAVLSSGTVVMTRGYPNVT